MRDLNVMSVRITLLLFAVAIASARAGGVTERPAEFVDVQSVIPGIALDLRYATAHNFIGRPIAGYAAATCLLTKPAADQKMKTEFYPNVDKRDLFREGYIAAKSGHSRGSTLDLTIVPLPQPTQPVFDPAQRLQSCENRGEARFADNSVDMGTGYDCFSTLSHTDNHAASAAVRANRELLKSLMERHGFVNLAEEWWHYTLRDEPFPDTCFDFPIEKSP